jgi:hypothetical protein
MSRAFRAEDDSLANRVALLQQERADLGRRLRARPARVPPAVRALLVVLGVVAFVGPLATGCVSCNRASKQATLEREVARRELCRRLGAP